MLDGMWRKIVIAAAIALAGASPALAAEKLLVFAAASLTESMNAAADAYARTGHERPVISFAASSALARQIENGAPAGLFVSADEEWMDYLATRALIIAASRKDFLGNRLALIAPADRPLRIAIRPGFGLAAALGGGKLAMADPDSVPAGKYGKAALTRLGVWSAVEPSVVRAENVRAALAFVEKGGARAGIVYRTDALASHGVMLAGLFPANSHPPIVYPLAILTAHDTPEARDFRRFLLSRAGKTIFARFGFQTR